MLEVYDALQGREEIAVGNTAEEDEVDNPNFDGEENLKRFRYHKRLERNAKLVAKVKQLQGYRCGACGLVFAEMYPGISNNHYIECHHLVPISELKGKRVTLDAAKDFAVLCANCHRMIHRFESPHDIAAFKLTFALNYCCSERK